jgi:parallel beta-helix repeat protein
MSNDDGGGIRFLQAGNFPMLVANNMITNNVSSHEGGGISLDDAPQVTIINNTIAKNLTTATAVTSNGSAAPAGISTAQNSVQLQATLAPGSPIFSNPVIANNILWDNRAGSWSPSKGVQGIGAAGDTTPINVWDIGSIDNIGKLSPVGSLLSTAPDAANNEGYNNPAAAGNRFSPPGSALIDPRFANPFDLQLDIQPLRVNFRFRPSAIVNVSLPTNGIGDYHIKLFSAAQLMGTPDAQKIPGAVQPPFPTSPINPPTTDIDGQSRSPFLWPFWPLAKIIDAGADQISRLFP